MSARTRTRAHRPAPDTVEVRLPWWAVVLPSLAFAALLLLAVEPGQAHAASGAPAIGRLLGFVLALLPA
jgi:sirohydrochlorin ferrochelatase